MYELCLKNMVFANTVSESSMPSFLSVLLLLLFVAPAHAEVYKCTGEGNRIVYSDSPCHAGDTQTLTGILPEQNMGQPPLAKKPAVILQLDAAVKSAIAADDLTRATALATTREHWEWIAEAKKTSAKNKVAPSQAESDECGQAKHELELEANRSDPKPEVLQAKRSLMYAACGLPEPIELVNDQPAAALFPYPYSRNRHGIPGRHPHSGHDKPSGYTSPPYDRRMAEPFGSRFIRPEDAPR
jgi:hypothetical protein